jgi:peptidoglycan hydrolase CwlO-like protein
LTKSFESQLNEKMNELVANHQSVISQKDKQLADYQKQVESLQKAGNELTNLIEEQKAKNNVSLIRFFFGFNFHFQFPNRF